MASSISAGNATNGVVVSSDNTGALNLITGSGSGTTAVAIDSSQNVGVGTLTPVSRLSVKVGTNQNLNTGSSQILSSGTRIDSINDAANANIPLEFGGNSFAWITNGFERARIDTSGNLLIGTTSAAGVVAVKQSGAAAWSNCLSLIDSASANKWGILFDSGTTRLYFGYNAVSKSYIDQVTGAYTAISDSRLKENIEPLSVGLLEVLQLNPVTYNFKSDDTKANQVGLIAQEVLEIIPEVVGVPIDETNGSYGINYAGLTPILVKAIQELKAELDALKAKVGE
jgi:hypothetical protein